MFARIAALTFAASTLLVAVGTACARDRTPDPDVDAVILRLRRSSVTGDFQQRQELRDLASAGRAASTAAPLVAAIASRKDIDFDVRVAAIRALGEIGGDDAVPTITAAFDDPRDFRAHWAAAVALGRMRAIQAAPVLDRVAREHPYPPVRIAASASRDRLSSHAPDPDYDPPAAGNFAMWFFAYENIGEIMPRCRDPIDAGDVRESTPEKRYASSDPGLEAWSFPTAEDDFRSGEPAHHGAVRRSRPDVAFRVEDGWMLAVDRGEWGGALAFRRDDGTVSRLIDMNVSDVVRLDRRIIAFAGFAHLSSNRGVVYELTRDATGEWRATPWRALPGAAFGVRPVGEVLIVDMVAAGRIALSRSGGMRVARCDEG